MNKEIIKKTKLTINGKTFFAEENQTILQACEKIGLFIPRFCYNEALSIAGNCRMCLVEIEKSPKLMPACAIKIGNEMKINTKTNLVKKARESILEFLLINHPLDCPICDQGGECDLQDQAMVYGSDRGRFYEYKRSLQDKNAGPLIKTIMTRCIHCTRCIRYATEIAGIEVYGTTGRGKNMEVGTYISNLFNSEISGNVVDLCPVGALTSKPYAFTVRPWELKNIESIDILDAMGSNIRIDIRGSELMRILPKSNNKINQQWISDKTRYAYDSLKNQRLYYPMVKKESKFLTLSWKKAINIITKKLRQTNSKKIGGYIGNFIDEESILTFKKLLNQIGVNKYYIEHNNGFIPNKTNNNFDFRSNYLFNINLENLESSNIDTILLIGTNPRYEASMLNVRIRQWMIKKKKEKINIIKLGSNLNLTYESKHLNTNLLALWLLTQGKSKYSKQILKSKNPITILSSNIIERKDGKSIKYLVEKLFDEKINIIKKLNKNNNKRNLHNLANYFLNKNNNKELDTNPNKNINILHTIASIPGALDLGFASNKNNEKKELELNFLLGADSKNTFFHKNSFNIFIGHHGCNTAKKSDIILPSTSFVEKKATYVNIQGYVQQTQIALNSDYNIYHDWQILEKISKNLNISGPLNKKRNYKNIPIKDNKILEDSIYILNTNKKAKLGALGALGEKKNNNKKILFQIILNNLLENYYNYLSGLSPEIIKEKVLPSVYEENKKKLPFSRKEISSEIDRGQNFNEKFENIAPLLNNLEYSGSLPIQKIYPKKLKYKKNQGIRNILYKTSIIYDRDNFYLSDIITKASITMGKCSALFKNNNFGLYS